MQITSGIKNRKNCLLRTERSVLDMLSRMQRPRPLQHITDNEPILEQMNMYTATFVFP
jgi:hypothetical protein